MRGLYHLFYFVSFQYISTVALALYSASTNHCGRHLTHHAQRAREQIPAPVVLKAPYVVLCWVIDVLFENRPLPVGF